MNIRFNQVVTRADWMKIGILLVTAMVAWYYVFTLYSQPFDLTSELQRQQLRQQYEYTKQPPVSAPK